MAKKDIVCWTDPGGCMYCKHCEYSPYDEPYCTNLVVAPKHRWPFGLGINSALKVCKRKFFQKWRE